MTDIERIEQRLTAVERTVTGDDVDLSELERVAERIDELEAVEARLEDLSERVASLEADVEALGGYAAEVESVNTDVERQAYAAFATVDRLEERVEEIGDRVEDLEDRDPPAPVARDDADGQPGADARESADAVGTGGATGATGAASSGGATDSGEVATPDGGGGSMGPFVPATADEEPAGDGTSGDDPAADQGPSLTEAVRNEENGDGTSTTDQSSVDELFEGTEESDDAAGSADDGEGDGGFIDALRAKLS